MIPGDAVTAGAPTGQVIRWHVPDGWTLVLDCGWVRDRILQNEAAECGHWIHKEDIIIPAPIPWHVGNDVYRVNWYRQNVQEMFVPLNLPVTNAGAESGDDGSVGYTVPDGWTAVTNAGSPDFKSVSARPEYAIFPAYEGERYFEPHHSVTEAIVSQDISIPDVGGSHAAIDDGWSLIWVQWQQASHLGDEDDPPVGRDVFHMKVQFFDSSMDSLGSEQSSPAQSVTPIREWQQKEWITAVPPGTRTVRLFQRYVKGAGDNFLYELVDDIKVSLLMPLHFNIAQVWEKESFGAVPTDWPKYRDFGTDLP